MINLEQYKVNIPEGKSGDWEVKKFIVSEDDAKWDALRSIGRGGRYTPAGTYTSLSRNGQVIMSDTPNEFQVEKPEVEFVTVIEKSPHVISLVAPYFQVNYGNKVKIIWVDAYTYKPPKDLQYGSV